jgi:hypothetical protein
MISFFKNSTVLLKHAPEKLAPTLKRLAVKGVTTYMAALSGTRFIAQQAGPPSGIDIHRAW